MFNKKVAQNETIQKRKEKTKQKKTNYSKESNNFFFIIKATFCNLKSWRKNWQHVAVKLATGLALHKKGKLLLFVGFTLFPDRCRLIIALSR